MRKKTAFALTFVIALASCACQKQSTTSEIKELKKQLENETKQLQKIEKENCAEIRENCHFCDSMLQFAPKEKIEAYFEKLNLAQAYLLQFNEMKPVMEKKFDYAQQQLDNLMNDITSNYINDSLANIYLSDEQKVADTLHEQLLYFEDRLGLQKKELNSLKQTLLH